MKRLDGREAAFSVKKLDIKVLIIKMIDLHPATVIWRGREERKPGLETSFYLHMTIIVIIISVHN